MLLSCTKNCRNYWRLYRPEIEVEACVPGRELSQGPNTRPLRKCVMPWARFEYIEFGNDDIHVRIALDEEVAWIEMIRSKIVTRCMPGWSPHDAAPFGREEIGDIMMSGA